MRRKVIAVLAAALLIAALPTGCKKENEEASSSEAVQTTAAVSEIDKPETADTPDSAEELSPYDFPYDIEQVKLELIEYGEQLGLIYDDSVTMKNATSIVNNNTKAAANGAALERWCKQDIDSIIKIAHYQNVALDRIGFNIVIYDSPSYGGEYIIGIYSETD